MKTIATGFFVFFLCFSVRSQVKIIQENVLISTKENLLKAQTIQDIFADVPKNPKYISFELLATVNGKTVQATCSGDTLKPGFLEVMRSADLNTKLYFDIKYGNDPFHPFVKAGSLKIIQ